jgi:NAD kinase
VLKKLGDELMGELQCVSKYLMLIEKMNIIVEPDVHQQLAEQGGLPDVYTYTPEQGRRLGDFIDLVVCLGGDGVLLHAVQLFGENVPPIIAFHLGSLGFLSQHRCASPLLTLHLFVLGSHSLAYLVSVISCRRTRLCAALDVCVLPILLDK